MVKINDKDIRNLTGTLLRVGVYLAMGIVVAGGITYLFHHGNETADYSVFNKDKVALKTIGDVFANLLSFRGGTIIQFGLVMLIFTPIARIILAIIGFSLERDYLYVLIGFIILAIIALSLSGGFTH